MSCRVIAYSGADVREKLQLLEAFEVEAEISIHALELHMPEAEVVTAYKVRPEGSTSSSHSATAGASY